MDRATAATWYRIQPLGDGVTLIDEPWILPFYRCNCWHVAGRDRDLLVDTGMGVVPLRAQVPLLRREEIVCVASHTHFDHIGAHHEFALRLVHPAEAAILADPDNRLTLADPYVDDAIFTRLPPEPYRSADYRIRPAPATGLVVDGDVIDLGDRRFTVIHTPGHSPGGIALFEERTGILIAGDIVYDGPLVEDTYHSDAGDYLRSMRRLLELPVRIVHGGHFASFDGARLRAIVTDWLRRKDAL